MLFVLKPTLLTGCWSVFNVLLFDLKNASMLAESLSESSEDSDVDQLPKSSSSIAPSYVERLSQHVASSTLIHPTSSTNGPQRSSPSSCGKLCMLLDFIYSSFVDFYLLSHHIVGDSYHIKRSRRNCKELKCCSDIIFASVLSWRSYITSCLLVFSVVSWDL